MSKRIPLEGKQFNSWTVLKYVRNYQNHSFYLCRCVCGVTKEVSGNYLRSDRSRSCRCQDYVNRTKASKKFRLPYWKNIVNIHRGMKLRCLEDRKSNANTFKNYGARGIKIADEWLIIDCFYEWAIKGYKPGLQIDRIDNNGNYEPSNCRWVTNQQNSWNTRKIRIFETLEGERIYSLVNASKYLKVNKNTLLNWLRKGDRFFSGVRHPEMKLKLIK